MVMPRMVRNWRCQPKESLNWLGLSIRLLLLLDDMLQSAHFSAFLQFERVVETYETNNLVWDQT